VVHSRTGQNRRARVQLGTDPGMLLKTGPRQAALSQMKLQKCGKSVRRRKRKAGWCSLVESSFNKVLMDDLLGLDMTFVAFVRKGTSNESVISQLVIFAPPDLLMR
jgi:hypothetical protein